MDATRTSFPAETTNRQRWLYSIANLGNVIPYQAVSAILLFYYTDYKHLPVGWAATAMTIYAIYNAFNNPLMGYLSDRTRTHWGRRIPYLLFCTLPYVVAFALIWMAPFDGQVEPTKLLIYFYIVVFIWEGLGTAVSTAYYSLLPEMFMDYKERTDVAVRMNIVQTVGLLIGAALPAVLASALGYPLMGIIFAVIAGAAMYFGLPGMFERKGYQDEEAIPLGRALKETLVNRSFITVVIAQTLRFFATGILTTGMIFYMKYSIGSDPAMTTISLAVAFVAAGLSLWPWRHFIANRFEARTTTMIAYAITGLASIPLAFAHGTVQAILASALVGVGLAGLILMGDVIMADVVDEDDVHTGQRRAGMFFGMSGLIITLSSALVAQVFGWLMPLYGYDTALAVQPATVGEGFRIFMSIPSVIGCGLAVLALAFYPLHGDRLKEVKRKLVERQIAKEKECAG
jgi:GPH family glycoside/pentoside/hexuronide:cation symporter